MKSLLSHNLISGMGDLGETPAHTHFSKILMLMLMMPQPPLLALGHTMCRQKRT